MSVCKVFLVGRVGASPELRRSSGGNPWTTLSVATNRRVPEGESWVEKTSWHKVKVFGNSAEACHRLLRKGSLVSVEGHLDYERWTDREGRERFGVSIVARRVAFLERYGSAEADPPAVTA